jgi:hypothetical protein
MNVIIKQTLAVKGTRKIIMNCSSLVVPLCTSFKIDLCMIKGEVIKTIMFLVRFWKILVFLWCEACKIKICFGMQPLPIPLLCSSTIFMVSLLTCSLKVRILWGRKDTSIRIMLQSIYPCPIAFLPLRGGHGWAPIL